MKSKIASIVALLLFLTSPVFVNATSKNEIIVVINGEFQQFDTALVNVKGSVLVPMRAIFEKLNANVKWNQEKQQVTATKDNKIITLTIGSKVARINEQEIQLNVEPQLINGKTMVPLRFIGEALGANVKWVGESNTVDIFYTEQNHEDVEIETENIKNTLTKYYDAIYAKDFETYNGTWINLSDKSKKENEYWLKNSTHKYEMNSIVIESISNNEASMLVDIISKKINTDNKDAHYVEMKVKQKFKLYMKKIDGTWKIDKMELVGNFETLPNPNPEEI